MGSLTKILFLLIIITMVVFSGCKSPWVSSANIYLDQQNNPDKAEEALQQALEQNPNDPEAHFLMGRVHRIKERYVEMAASFDRSLEISSRFKSRIDDIRERVWREMYNNQGVPQFNEGDYEETIRSMETADIVMPNRWETYNLMGMAYDGLKDHEQAAATYRKSVELQTGPKNFDLYYRLAVVLFQLEEYEECYEYTKTVIDESTDEALRQDAAKLDRANLESKFGR